MRNQLRMLQWGFIAATVVYAGAAYRISTQQPDRPGWSNCLLIFIFLELLVLIYYSTCVLTCGNPDEPLDPACTWVCLRRFLWASLILVFFLLSCIVGTHL